MSPWIVADTVDTISPPMTSTGAITNMPTRASNRSVTQPISGSTNSPGIAQ